MKKRAVLISKADKYGGCKNPPATDFNGFILLCAAIIARAHEDYLTEDDRERKQIVKFLKSDLFKLYTLNRDIDSKDVLDIWERERASYVNNI